MLRKITCFLLLACFSYEAICQGNAASPAQFNPYAYSVRKKVSCSNGAVVSAHPLASKVGLLILMKGGNAFDAAIATQLALAVVYPGAGNLGGGGFLVGRTFDGENFSIDFRETAPARATRDMYLDRNGTALTRLSQEGHLAAGVPGTVAGLFATAKYGKLDFKTLIQPAIDLAENGFAITEAEAASLNSAQAGFVANNTRKTAFVKEEGWKSGDTLRQPELARTLHRIREKGRKGFYEGETARLIVAEMKRGKGIISMNDLKSYRAVVRKPVVFDYKGDSIITMPLPGSGGVLLPMMMNMLERYPVRSYGFHSVQAVHLMTEIERLAYADRAAFLGDPDHYSVPVNKLISEEYAGERLKLLHPEKAGKSSEIGSGRIAAESEETTHLSIYDKEGNAVAVTTTLNGSYGSKTVAGGAGFLLNNEMDDFSIKPGVPNMYGAVGGEANAIVPGKRMLSSMTPTIVLRKGKPLIVAGTPGGTTIITSVFQTLVNLLDFGLSTEEAVNSPKFHHQWLPDTLFVEKDFPDTLVAALQKMGHTVERRGSIGRTEVIHILPDGTIEAVADKRGDDSAEGF